MVNSEWDEHFNALVILWLDHRIHAVAVVTG